MLLTKEIKDAIKNADAVCFDFEPIAGLESYERDRRAVTVRIRNSKPDRTTKFEGFAGRVATGNGNKTRTVGATEGWTSYEVYSDEEDNWYRPESGAWVFISAAFQEHLQSVFRSIPVGSELTFSVLLDNRTSPNLVAKKMHGDALIVKAQPAARKGGKQPRAMTFDLETQVGEHNTARFGYRVR